MNFSDFKKYSTNKYLLWALFVLGYYSASNIYGIDVKYVLETKNYEAYWFFYVILYFFLPIISVVVLYRLIFIEQHGITVNNHQIKDLFINIFDNNDSVLQPIEVKLLKYEEYLFGKKSILKEKMNKTEKRGIFFASTAILFPSLTYIIVFSASLSENNFPNLITLTFPNLTIATIGISIGITLINLSKKINVEINALEEEILKITKMRLVISTANSEEMEDIKKKVQYQLINWSKNEIPKQEESADVPTLLSNMQKLMTKQ